MKMWKKAASVALASAMVFSLAACGSGNGGNDEGNSDATTFKIGGIGPITGDTAIYGTAVQNGIQLAVDRGGRAGASIRQAGFLRVKYIVGTVIQPCPYGNDFVIGHYTASRTSRHACCTSSDAAWISARVASPRALA